MPEKTYQRETLLESDMPEYTNDSHRPPKKCAAPFYPEGALSCTPEGSARIKDRRSLEEAMRNGATVEALCTMCDCRTMQLTVEFPDGICGFIPRSEVGFNPDGGDIKDIAVITRVGKPVQFKIRDIYEDENGVLCAQLSRRAAQKECFEQYISTLRPGDIIPARITHLEPFGAFCDIGCGIVSLLTVDRVSVSRISHPSDRFKSGGFITAIVSSVEESGRIYLSHRELLGTWEENVSSFSAGQTVTGIIRSVEEYGIFVELTPNLAGLAEAFEGAVPGDSCSVYIKSIIPERMKIKLVIIDSFGKAAPTSCKYLVDPSISHMSSWRYSPENCSKTVETIFD